MDDQDLKATSRRKPRTAVWLSVAGVAILALGVVLGRQWDSTPDVGMAEQAPTPTSAGLPVAAPSTGSTGGTEAKPGPTWLADLPVLASSSIDAIYTESPWTIAPARVRGVTFAKSVAATGAWCSAAQLVFALDGKFERFTAQVSITDNSPGTKGIDFYVLADDKRVAEIENVRTAPQPVEVAVTGVARLTIGVEPPSTEVGCPGPERVGAWVDPALTAVSPATTAPPS